MQDFPLLVSRSLRVAKTTSRPPLLSHVMGPPAKLLHRRYISTSALAQQLQLTAVAVSARSQRDCHCRVYVVYASFADTHCRDFPEPPSRFSAEGTWGVECCYMSKGVACRRSFPMLLLFSNSTAVATPFCILRSRPLVRVVGCAQSNLLSLHKSTIPTESKTTNKRIDCFSRRLINK